MGIQFTGLASGLDTQSIIKDLMKVERMKVENVEKDKTKAEWKKEVWSEMNTKLYSFYKDDLFKFKSSGTYSQKSVKSSNESVISMNTSTGAVRGSHSIEIMNMAKNSSLTSSKQVSLTSDGTKATKATKMSELITFDGENPVTLRLGTTGAPQYNGDGDLVNFEEVTITKDDTIATVMSKVKDLDLDLNMSYDETYGRFFVSSTKTGADVQLAIKADTAEAQSLVDAMGLAGAGFGVDGVTLAAAGEDASFKYNGTELSSASNEVTVNGLSFDILADSGTSTVTVNQDTDAIYDSVKDFILKYNEILDTMNTKIGADSARKYKPLTDEEKEAMTDKEVELWENKIKDSLLRRDDTLTSIRSEMRSTLTLSSGVDVEGLDYQYLSDLGIVTGSYTENGMLHIQGDEDDTLYSLKENELRDAIENDPDAVMEFFTKIGTKLYDSMAERMKSSTTSSALTFFEDKAMDKKVDEYDDRIAQLEDRLNMVEQRYYNQFTAMEQAIQKSNSTGDWLSQQLSAL